MIAIVGEYHASQEFLAEARHLRHPFIDQPLLPEDVRIRMFKILVEGVPYLDDDLKVKLERWRSLADAVACSEASIRGCWRAFPGRMRTWFATDCAGCPLWGKCRAIDAQTVYQGGALTTGGQWLGGNG
eukprot:221931-Amphidinium_carterae.2